MKRPEIIFDILTEMLTSEIFLIPVEKWKKIN